MLRLSDIFINRKVLSLRTGGPIGDVSVPVINPDNLKLEGWYATANGERDQKILPAVELRDIISKGIVVNDYQSLTDIDDMVRLKNVIDIGYELIGKNVETENGKKLGKIQDYAVDTDTMYIQKLYVNPSLLKGLSARNQLIIGRNQIIETTNKKIIVKQPDEKVKARNTAAEPAI